MPSRLIRSITHAAIFTTLAACASSTQVAKTYSDETYENSSFSNFLVIGVAGNYDSRAQFERRVVAGLKSAGVAASTYYSLVPGNKPISRDAVLAAVHSGNFDAVLLTRVLDQRTDVNVKRGSTELKSSTIGGNPVNFFRYDYEELNEPENISFSSSVVLGTELFSAADERMIWAIKSSSTKNASVGTLIDDTAASIVSRLRRDGYIGH